MNELTLANRASDWHRLKALVLDSVSSPITRRVYNLGLDEFIAWYGQAPRPGFTKATVHAWRAELEARGLGSVSINVRITAVRKLAVEAADNGLLAPELAAGITRVKGAKSTGRGIYRRSTAGSLFPSVEASRHRVRKLPCLGGLL
ncbi:MAG: site-specific integrase [Bryobacteraceae bacterium]|jgi:site-specific recombinase XerC